ncbi:MAG: class I adenylate-forming enzyme family protein [Alphaproteobacteria bacterium]
MSGLPASFDAPAPLLPEILTLHGRWQGRKPALICGGKSYSWAQLDRRLNQVANGLNALGIGRGDMVAVMMKNGVDMVEAMFGAIKAGAAAVPLNLSVSDEGLARQIHDCGARAIVATPAEAGRIDGFRAQLPALRHNGFLLSGGERPGWTAFGSWRDGQGAAAPAAAVTDEDPCNIIYSSGTTGLPKGIVHSHRRRLDWAYDLAIALRYHPGAVTVCSIGLFSNISWVCLLCTFLAGGTIVVLPEFSPRTFLEATSRHRATHTAMVPLQYQKVLDDPEFNREQVASLHAVMSCGSPLHAGLKKRLFEELGCDLIELYGLTEGLITTLAPEEAEGRLASVGKPLPGTDLKIIGEDGTEVPAGTAGEIAGYGRIVMTGYHNRPDATREAMWQAPDGRIWLRTGDIGRLDEEGFLYIVDRKKDMILSGGQNIFPADIEAVMAEHPEVEDVGVIGVPHEKWGETPLALVVPKPGAKVTEAELLAWTNERVGRQQRISAVEFRTDLPRNPNGKLLKRELRVPYWDGGTGGEGNG